MKSEINCERGQGRDERVEGPGVSASAVDNHSSCTRCRCLASLPSGRASARSTRLGVRLSRNLSPQPTCTLSNPSSASHRSHSLVRLPSPIRLQAGLKSRCQWPSSSLHPTLHREGCPSFCPPTSVQTATSWSLSANSGNTSALHPLRPAAVPHYRTSSHNASSRWSHLQLVLKLPGHHLPKPHLQLPH